MPSVHPPGYAPGTSDSKPLNTPPYEHCTLIKLLWARVALLNFFVVCEHDLTMDALLLVTLDAVTIVTYLCKIRHL